MPATEAERARRVYACGVVCSKLKLCRCARRTVVIPHMIYVLHVVSQELSGVFDAGCTAIRSLQDG